MTSTNDGKDVKSNQISGHKSKSHYIELYTSLEKALSSDNSLEERTRHVCEAWRRVYGLYQHSATSTHPHLLSWLQRHTANTVLQSKWAKSKNEHTRLSEAIDSLVAEATAASAGRPQHLWEQILLQRAAWFKKALENPWDNPVLKSLINPDSEPVTDEQVLEWLISEHGIVLVTRLQRMVGAGNCDDLALLLASAVMDRARAATKRTEDECSEQKVEEEDSTSFVAVLERDASFTSEEWDMLTDIELVLLLKTDKRQRCIELAKLFPLRLGYKMVERLRKRLETSPRDKKLWKHAKEVATIVTQVIIARCMVLSTCAGAGRDALYWCSRSLARLVEPDQLRRTSTELARLAVTARHLHTFCAALSAECKELKADVLMKPFICELYVRAITAGMNELEQLKLKPEKESEARLYEQTLAGWFTQLGGRLTDSVRLRAECALTAFSVHPARKHYERVANTAPPVRLPQAQEPTTETTSEYGSWANDSRTQSNLVKTSETLQLKQSEKHQANVLSTAILTEGEALGLEPELCQDLAVLLSGPRVKTLSWDMDREVLLENCRSYMEKTHGGTRAVTTELKFLNLDPNAYQHLPEEEDDENDVYYGIEKGYEHEVQFEEPEEIWQNAFFDPEQTESADDSEVDRGFGKKKSKALAVVDSEDEDPLSTIADAKKEKKKRAKEKDKEQKKKKAHKRDDSKDGSTERRKDKDKKTKKERKKDKSEQAAAGSLNSLLGMKVAKVSSPVQDGEKRVRKKKERRRESSFNYVSVTDSDQISDDPSVLVDGVFSMDELKSPEKLSTDRQKLDNTKTTIKTEKQSPVINDIKTRPMSSPTVTTTSSDSDVTRAKSPYMTPNQLAHRHVVNPQVKSSLHKLLQFRRNQNKLRAVARPAPAHHTPTQTNAVRPSPAHTPTQTNLARPTSTYNPTQSNLARPSPAHTPTHTNMARPPPAHTPTQSSSLVGMKVFNPDEVPKVYLNKKQSKQLESLSNDLNNLLKDTSDNEPRTYKDKPQNQHVYPQKYQPLQSNPVPQNLRKESQTFSDFTTHRPVIVVQQPVLDQLPSSTQTSYTSPAKTELVRPRDVNFTPQKPTIVYHPFHKSMQNLSTDKREPPKKPLLINDPNYFSQQKANASQLSPKIISNTVIKPPSHITVTEDFKKSQAQSNIQRTYMTKPTQNLNSDLTLTQMLYERQKQNSSMQNRHISTPQDMLHGRQVSHAKSYNAPLHNDAFNSAQPLYSNSTDISRSGLNQNRERIDTRTPLISETSEIDDLLKELYKSIHSGGKNVSVDLNKDVKLSIQTPSTTKVTPQCAKPQMQKKTENVPTTFSRLSYMHKNKQNESKVPLTDCVNKELNRQIIEHKISKAKCIKNDVTLSRIGLTHPVTDPQKTIGRLDQSGTRIQKNCPLLSSMLEATPVSPNFPPQSCTSTSSHNPAQNIPNREDADLLLLLRNPTLMKSNLSTYMDNASTGSDKSPQTLNPQTKVETQVSNSQTLVGAKIKNMNILESCTTKKDTTSDENEWKRVMDDLRARKTEPLGPNALELALKKDQERHSLTIGKRVSDLGQSLLQNRSSDTKKREHHSSKASSSSRNPSTEKHSEVPKKPRHAEVIKKISPDVLKRLEVQNKHSCSNITKEVPSSANPNSDFDMLDDLIDDDLRRELGEISSDEDSYTIQNAPICKGKSQKNIPKQNSIVSKAANMSKEKTHIANPKTTRKNQTNSNAVVTQVSTGVSTFSTTDYPNVIVNNSSQPGTTHIENSSRESKPEMVQQYAPTTTIITDQVAQNTANNILTRIEANQYVNSIIPTNVIIASVPQTAPVVVIRQDLVYDPYPTIRIHESQVNAELCAINQNVYAVNAAPNLALYQTTQFAAPVINPIIIGNATTTTNAPNPTAMGNESVTQDFAKEELNMPVESNISLETALRISDAISETPEPQNLDFNMNQNCERKVLSQVQQNNANDVDKECHKSRISNDDVPLRTEQDKERIKLKRQSLLNRKISHFGGLPPIVLTYAPLSKKATVGNILHPKSPKNGIAVPNPTLKPSPKNGIVAATAGVPATEGNNGSNLSTVQASDAKENKQSIRRISLRSSNKITNNIAAPVKQSQTPLKKKIVKLQVTDNVIKHGNTTITKIKNKDCIKIAKRTSNRKLNNNKANKSQPMSPVKIQQNVAESSELIDFEEELNSSKILKTSTATIETHNLENTSTQELGTNTLVIEKGKQSERCIFNKIEEKEMTKTSDAVGVFVDERNKLKPTAIEENTKQVSVMKNEHETASVASSPLLDETNKIKSTIVDDERDVKQKLAVNLPLVDQKEVKNSETAETSVQSCGTDSIEVNKDDIKSDKSQIVPNKVIESDATAALHSNRKIIVLKEGTTIQENTENKITIETGAKKPVQIASLECPEENVNPVSEVEDDIVEIIETSTAAANTQTKIVHSNNLPDKTSIKEQQETIDTSKSISSKEIVNDVHNDKSIHQNITTEKVDLPKLLDRQLSNQKQTNTKPEMQHKSLEGDEKPQVQTTTNALTNSSSHTDVTDTKNKENSKTYMKGDIKIKEITLDDPTKTAVRIFLPNGKVFKATITGKVHGDIDSLFAEPSMRAILSSSLNNDGSRYTINYKQVQVKTNPSKPIYKIHDLQIKGTHSAPIDTVNLISDDEDDVPTRSFNTEFGKYVTNHDQETIDIHQKKFDQRCEVKMLKGDLFKSNRTKSKSKSMPSEKNSLLTRHQSKLLSVVTSTITKEETDSNSDTLSQAQTSPTPPLLEQSEPPTVSETPDVIELDDSSNDSFENQSLDTNAVSNKNIEPVKVNALANLLLQDLGLEQDEVVKLPSPVKSGAAVVNLKSALLQDLGIAPTVTPVIDITENDDDDEVLLLTDVQKANTNRDEKNSHVTTEENKTRNVEQSNLKKCVVKLMKCETLIKKYELMRKMKNCYVKMERLENMLLPSASVCKLSDRQTDEMNQNMAEDFIAFDVDEPCSTPQLSRCPSLSILNNWDDDSQPSLENPYCTSPVMEIYDMLVQLRNKLKTNLLRESIELLPMTCDSEWNMTKFQCSTQQIILSSSNIPVTENQILLPTCDRTVTAEKLMTFETPKLLTITLKFLEDTPNLLCRWESARRRELISKDKSSPNKLKRKAEEVVSDVVASKVLKLKILALKTLNSHIKTPSILIEDQHMALQPDIFEASCKYNTVTIGNLEDGKQAKVQSLKNRVQTKVIVDSVMSPTDIETQTIFKKENHHPSNILDNIETLHKQSDTVIIDGVTSHFREVNSHVACRTSGFDTFDNDFLVDDREVTSPSLLCDYTENFVKENENNKNLLDEDDIQELTSSSSLSDITGGCDKEKQINADADSEQTSNDLPTHAKSDNSSSCVTIAGDNDQLNHPSYSKNIETSDEKKDILEVTLPSPTDNNEVDKEHNEHSKDVEHFVASSKETQGLDRNITEDKHRTISPRPREDNSEDGNQNEGNTFTDSIKEKQDVTSSSFTDNNEFDKENDTGISINKEKTENYVSQSKEVELSTSSSEIDCLDRDTKEKEHMSAFLHKDGPEECKEKLMDTSVIDNTEDNKEVVSLLADHDKSGKEKDDNNEEAVKDVSQSELEYSVASSTVTDNLGKDVTEANQQSTYPLPRNDDSEDGKEKQIDINPINEETTNKILQLQDVESFDLNDAENHQKEFSPSPLSNISQISDKDEGNLSPLKEIESSTSLTNKNDFDQDITDNNLVDLSPPPLSDNTETDDEKNEMCLINSERFSKASENPIANSQHETDYSNNDNIQDIPVVTASPPLNERIITDPGEAATDKDATEDRKSLKSPISRKEHIETIENQLSEIAGGQDLTTDTLHVEEIEDSVGLDEDSVDEITTEVCEVVVIATDVYDDDIAETLINTSKEMNLMVKDVSGINRDSELKSPDFIDNKTIAFNYHDYTKRSKNKQDITTGTSICNHISDPTRDNVSVSDLKTESITLNERYIHHEPSSEIPTIRDCYHKSKPELKYELIQEDDFLTVKITTENDEDNKTKAIISPKDIEEDTVVASPCSNNTDDMNLKGFELEDVYIFPLSQAGSNNSNLSSDSIVQELHSESVTGNLPDDLHDIEFHVKEPEMTYSRKRKMDMRDVKIAEKKYRKGKNIDCSKQTQISMIELAYSKEYKRLLEYCSSVKFSYTRPFHKECIEIENLMVNWPINSVCHDVTPADVADERLFVDLEVYDSYQPDPATQTFVEEISYEYNRNDAAREGPTIEASETNFNMGFGEGSGRVIQILNTQSKSNISAATLPDVKQSQPVFKSVNSDDCNDVTTNNDDQIKKIRQHVNFIELRDKVRQFFKKSIVELKSDWVHQNTKDELHPEDFPFGLCSLDYVKPVPTNVIVQVVQVGQLPVSAAAQNPVTCDPRVTQVSDASPSQCSVDNSPNDDSQSEIKTEYTELTTADLSLPLQQYAQQNQANLASQDNNVELIEQTISLEMEIKAEESPEIKQELPDIKEEKSNSSDTELHTLNNATPENMDYSFENNTAKSDASNVNYDSSEKKSSETFSQQRQQNGNSEKTDQIAHAMSAAGITTTPETVTNTRAHALVNILSQKIRQGSVNTTQTTTNTYSKTSINAMALQQALAQILPPPLNQTGSSENNQTQSTPVGPQVLHIVQGKNSSGNQITLVDNSQQSVISTPNATQVLHIVQNKNATSGQASNGTLTPQANSFSGLSLVDAGLQQGGNQLLHIVNTGNQKTASPGQLLKRVNLLTNLTNVQGSNEQKMVQFVCKSADGKAIQLNAPHQRSMVLRLQPIETPNVQTPPAKSAESQELNSSPTATTANKESASQQEIKSRSIYEENYAKFIQNSSSKTPGLEKSTSLPKFNQAFGKPVFQEGSQKQGETATNNSHLPSVNNNSENAECPPNDNAINLEHMGNISSPPLLIRKPVVTTQSQSNIVQQIKQTIAPMNIQTMHGGVIYTRQIPVNIGGGQTINLITVPSTELINDDSSKTQSQNNQGDIEPSIIKIVPQSQTSTNNDSSQEENNSHASGSNENPQTPQPQPVLTQMRIKLPMLSKAPQMVPGARVVRPSFFQIQRNVIGGANQPVYQQLVLTAAPPLGQQTIRLPSQASRPVKVPSENQSSSSESQMSSSTLEQLREFDMVLEQVKERSTSTPSGNSNNSSFKIHASSDTTDGNASSNCSTESTSQVLYSIGNNQALNVAYVNRKSTVTTPTTSTYVRSPDSSGIADSPTSSTHVQIAHTVTTDSSPTEMSSQSKPAKVGGSSKSKSRPKSTSNPPNTLKLSSSVPPKTSSQKPLEDEQTTQRILYILAEYKEQVENSPDKDKPAPRRRSNPPSNPGSSKRKKSSSSRRSGTRDMSPVHGEDTCRTMGSEDSSCGTSQGDCTESCLDSHSPQDSPRKVARKITFDQELNVTQPRPQPQRNVIVADGQTITVARGTTGKPATAVLMPANYILPVSMVKGGQQIAIVTNRGPKLLTVGGEGGATNALLLQRLIGPAGLKPVLARPGVRHVRLPTAALHNLQAFNLAPATTVQPPDSTASPTPGPTPPELVDTRATSSPWTDRDEVKPERSSSPEGSEPWNLPSTDAHDYSYEETVRTDNMDRTVLDQIPDRYSPDMEAQRIFDKMFDVDSKKSYADSPRCAYDIDPSDDDKAYQVVQKKDGSQRQHRLAHVSAAALRHKYAILEHELRLQKSLSEECEDLGVDSPSASELFPEAELLFANSPAHEHNQEHHSHTPQPHQSSIPQPDMDDQIATDHLIPREIDVSLGLGDVGIVAVSEDGSATIALDQEEFARSHPNTTFHSEPTEGEVQPFTITGLKGRHITSTIFHSNSAPATVLMTAPQATVISQAPDHSVKYEIENMINMPGSHNNDINLSSVLVKDDGLTRFDSILTDSRELHLTNTASAIVHSSGNATQVIRRVCYEDDKRERDARYLIDEPDNLIAGDDAKMIAEDSSRDATLESMADVDDDRSSPERHAELFWESNSASERSESRRPLDFSSDSDKCCKSPSFDETNSTDSSGVGTHMRLDSVIKEARTRERSGSADGSSADDTHPPLRTYPPKRAYHPLEGEAERSLSGKTLAGERSPDLEVRRRASGRGVVKRGCHCCNGSPAPPRPKKPRQRKPTLDFNTDN